MDRTEITLKKALIQRTIDSLEDADRWFLTASISAIQDIETTIGIDAPINPLRELRIQLEDEMNVQSADEPKTPQKLLSPLYERSPWEKQTRQYTVMQTIMAWFVILVVMGLALSAIIPLIILLWKWVGAL